MNNKKLFRSTTNRMVCGVCGGLGDFFGIDATVIRILYVRDQPDYKCRLTWTDSVFYSGSDHSGR